MHANAVDYKFSEIFYPVECCSNHRTMPLSGRVGTGVHGQQSLAFSFLLQNAPPPSRPNCTGNRFMVVVLHNNIKGLIWNAIKFYTQLFADAKQQSLSVPRSPQTTVPRRRSRRDGQRHGAAGFYRPIYDRQWRRRGLVFIRREN